MSKPARIIFVPGMKPKPPAEVYGKELCRCLRAGLERVSPETARSFTDECLTLVPWTFLFYGQHRDIELDRPGIDRILAAPEPTADDIKEIESLAIRITRMLRVLGDALPFFGRLIAKPRMRLTIAEAHRYLQDRRQVATAIRGLLREALTEAWSAGERVLLIGHSLGSVIAYDTLWELTHERREPGHVELFLTLGSPLGTRMVLKGVRGAGRRGRERYPTNIIRWQNFSARGELTALHPELKPFFGEMVDLGLLESLQDVTGFYNHFRGSDGLNVHMSYGYLINRAVAESIADWLEL